jgi:hypothetical protein
MLIVNPILVVYILKFTLYLEEGNCFEVVIKKVICQNHPFHICITMFHNACCCDDLSKCDIN